MQLLNPELIRVDRDLLNEIDHRSKSIFRTVTFCKKTSSKQLLDSFINSTNSLTELLSIKNAQMEAQNEDEVEIYIKNLNKAILFIVNEIKEGILFKNEVQLFQLFRLVSPESHAQHPNRYRDTLVQVGAHICPDSKEIPGLVSALFANLDLIEHPILKAIYFHHELIRIHPFADGNGRITRIAKNWMLMFELYPPIFIRDEIEKKEYIRSLSTSFEAVRMNAKEWNKETHIFFQQELDRILSSITFILDNLKNSQ